MDLDHRHFVAHDLMDLGYKHVVILKSLGEM